MQPQLSAGSIHAFCVNTQGSLFCWGRGADARLGLGDKQDQWVPTLLSGGFGGQLVKQVSAGSFHSVCVTVDGKIYSWGYGENGQLGLGDVEERLTPTLLTSVLLRDQVGVHVGAGAFHTLCATADGTLLAWGDNEFGQLGVGNQTDCLEPMLVDVQAVQVTAGGAHSACVNTKGEVFAWGHNNSGQIGVGDEIDRLVPTLVTLKIPGKMAGATYWRLKRASQVDAGASHTVCVTDDGMLFAWGDESDFYQLYTIQQKQTRQKQTTQQCDSY